MAKGKVEIPMLDVSTSKKDAVAVLKMRVTHRRRILDKEHENARSHARAAYDEAYRQEQKDIANKFTAFVAPFLKEHGGTCPTSIINNWTHVRSRGDSREGSSNYFTFEPSARLEELENQFAVLDERYQQDLADLDEKSVEIEANITLYGVNADIVKMLKEL